MLTTEKSIGYDYIRNIADSHIPRLLNDTESLKIGHEVQIRFPCVE